MRGARLQRTATDLRPSLLDHQGLAAALNWFGTEFARTTEIACRVRVTVGVGVETGAGCGEGDGAATALPDALATALFRIVQELLSNVARHARAAAVDVLVERRSRELVVVVADDGVGAAVGAFARQAATACGASVSVPATSAACSSWRAGAAARSRS